MFIRTILLYCLCVNFVRSHPILEDEPSLDIDHLPSTKEKSLDQDSGSDAIKELLKAENELEPTLVEGDITSSSPVDEPDLLKHHIDRDEELERNLDAKVQKSLPFSILSEEKDSESREQDLPIRLDNLKEKLKEESEIAKNELVKAQQDEAILEKIMKEHSIEKIDAVPLSEEIVAPPLEKIEKETISADDLGKETLYKPIPQLPIPESILEMTLDEPIVSQTSHKNVQPDFEQSSEPETIVKNSEGEISETKPTRSSIPAHKKHKIYIFPPQHPFSHNYLSNAWMNPYMFGYPHMFSPYPYTPITGYGFLKPFASIPSVKHQIRFSV